MDRDKVQGLRNEKAGGERKETNHGYLMQVFKTPPTRENRDPNMV